MNPMAKAGKWFEEMTKKWSFSNLETVVIILVTQLGRNSVIFISHEEQADIGCSRVGLSDLSYIKLLGLTLCYSLSLLLLETKIMSKTV